MAIGGNIAEVLDWVRGTPPGDQPADGWQDRAREALAVEQAKGEAARASLVAKLEAALAGQGDSTNPDPVDPTPPETADTAAGLAMPVEATIDDAGDGTAWYQTSNGTWHVPIGSDAHKRLVAEQAERIPDPTG